MANLLTERFDPLRTVQISRAEGGSETLVERSGNPIPVDVALELVEASLGRLQSEASLRVATTQLDLLGSLIDIKA